MSGPEFFQTRMGVRFFESDVPRMIEQLAKLNENITKLVALATAGDPDGDRERRDRIVSVAIEVSTHWVTQDGVNGALIDALAEACGLTRGG
jgi:hypothetical protein